MATVPQSTLNWLFTVLTKDHYDSRQTYHDPNRTYYDVANALAQYPTLLPRTDVYTYESGFSALALVLAGTLPVSFRGIVYRFPIAVWVPNSYPRDPPMVYVTPVQDMAVRVGQHVTLEGRIYHHYLAHWAEAWDRSTIVDLLSILREVFAKEPPVRYKQPQVPPQQPQPQAPPPLPPIPAELSPAASSPVSSSRSISQIPPQLPPKPAQASNIDSSQNQRIPKGTANYPVVPPPPPKPLDPRGPPYYRPYSSIGTISGDGRQQWDQPSGPEGAGQHRQSYQWQQAQASRASAAYSHEPAYTEADNSAGGREQLTHPWQPMQQNIGFHSDHREPSTPDQPTQSRQIARVHPQNQFQPPDIRPAPTPKTDTLDLLTSPFEVELPSFTTTKSPPPIPPNPEKDALLHAVSRVLAETLRSNSAQSESAGRSLYSQSQSLYAASAKMRSEIASFSSLNSSLQSNTSILQQSLLRADGAIADAQSRVRAPLTEAGRSGLPPIDEVLVAPTVVGKQLYDLVTEEAGIQQAIYALQAALVKGVIGVEAWSRHTRGLAREAFLKRAIIKKIGKGMGLEES